MKKRILIIDDESDILELLVLQISDLGFDVSFARSGEEAYGKILQFKFNLIITDVKLPGLTGIELINKTLKEVSADQSFFVMTGYSGFSEGELIKKGVKKVFYKPDGLRTMIDEVEKYY